MGSGIIDLVSKADRGRYRTIKQVADRVGRSQSHIKAAIRSGKVSGPTHKMPLGDGTSGAFVWLYTESDIRRLRRYFENTKRGPKPKKSDEEAA